MAKKATTKSEAPKKASANENDTEANTNSRNEALKAASDQQEEIAEARYEREQALHEGVDLAPAKVVEVPKAGISTSESKGGVTRVQQHSTGNKLVTTRDASADSQAWSQKIEE